MAAECRLQAGMNFPGSATDYQFLITLPTNSPALTPRLPGPLNQFPVNNGRHIIGYGETMAEAERIPGFSTLSIHAGAKPDPTTGARATPIYQTTSFVFDDVEHAASLFGLQAFGNIYSRIGNPTCAVLEERVAALEGGTAGLAVASGHAAQVIVMYCLMRPGDEFVAAKKLYGGSIIQFNHAFKNFGWNVVWADPDDIATFERAVSPKTKAIFVESIANPGGVITDIEAVARIAKSAG